MNISRETNPGSVARQSSAWRWIDGQYMPQLPVAAVKPWDLNPRKSFDEAGLAELAESIKEHGVQQPIVVRYLPDPARLLIVMGERRWRASQLAGRDTIPAIVRTDMDDETALMLAMAENVRRRDLNAIEEARGYGRLIEMGLKQAEIARELGCDPSAVSNARRLLKLPQDVQELIAEGKLSAGHGRAILRFEEFPAVMSAIAASVMKRPVPVRDLETGIPFVQTLQQAGLAKSIDRWSGVLFDTAVCQKCPFGALRKTDTDSQMCLRPAHYDELQAEAKAEQIRKAQEAAQQRQATPLIEERINRAAVAPANLSGDAGANLPLIVADGPKVVSLDKLQWGDYTRLDVRTPAGCSEACHCRTAAIDYNGKCVEVCLDPARYRGLQANQTRLDQKERRAQHIELLADVEKAKIANHSVLAGPERMEIARRLAMMLWQQVIRTSSDVRKKASETLPEGELRRLIVMQSYEIRDDSKGWRALADLGLVDLINFVSEITVRQELHQCIEAKSSSHKETDWILGRLAAPAEPELTSEDEKVAADDPDDDPEGYACARCRAEIAMDLLASPEVGEAILERWHRLESGLLCESDPGSDELITVYCAACAADVTMCRYCGCTQEHGCQEGCAWLTERAGDGMITRTWDVCTSCGDALAAEVTALRGRLMAGEDRLIGPMGRPYRVVPNRYWAGNDTWEVQAGDTQGSVVRHSTRDLVLRRWLPAQQSAGVVAEEAPSEAQTAEAPPLCAACGARLAGEGDIYCWNCVLDGSARKHGQAPVPVEAVVAGGSRPLCSSCGVEPVWGDARKYCWNCEPAPPMPSQEAISKL